MAGLSLCLVAVLVVTQVRDGRHDVAPGPVDVVRASPADAVEALAGFVAGVEDRDAGKLSALAPARDAAARATLSGVAANAASLDLRRVSARYVDQVGTVAADGTWSGTAEMSWQVGRLDRAPSSADVVVRFAPDGDELAIVGFGGSDAAGRVPLWLRGELSVATAPGVLVMADGGQEVAESTVRRVVRGIDVVRRILPGRVSPVVVEVPSSAAGHDETQGAPPGA